MAPTPVRLRAKRRFHSDAPYVCIATQATAQFKYWNKSRDLWQFRRLPAPWGTDREFECTRFITAELVEKTIERLLADKAWQNG